ncbi:MAG: hypothetical protein EP329_17340 [Deltaproteobacteria bacterium]|nr:MAG: hypothetical protein EP329_17340 [Deltaproteobacteria bacterium]
MNGTRPTLLLTLALGGFALWHAFTYMGTFNTTPPGRVQWTPPPALPTVTSGFSSRRVVVAIVDGLRLDHADLLGFPDDQGARCVLDAQLPSYSRPNYVALVTGAPPWLSGVHTNDHEGATWLESVFDAAAHAGWKTLVATDGIDWWGELFPSAFGERRFGSRESFPGWIATWSPPPGSVSLLHIVAADDDAHDHGVGAAYDAALTAAGAELRALWARLDPARDTLFVAADHGHLDRGGHGGPEQIVLETPLFVLGAGASTTRSGCHRQNTDLAATIAAVVGLNPPGASLGAPIEAVLDPARVNLDAVKTRTDAQLALLWSRTCVITEDGQCARDYPGMSEPPPADPAKLVYPPNDAPFRDRRPVAAGPIVLVSAIWLAFLGMLIFLTRRRHPGDAPAWPFAVRGVAYVGAYAGVVLGVEPAISFSAVWLRGPWIMHMVTLTLGAAILAWALTWVLNNHLRRHPLRTAGWVLLMSTLPFFAAAGLHGSLRGGPELGEPHSAFALLLGDFSILGGALTALLLVAFDGIRRLRGVAESTLRA